MTPLHGHMLQFHSTVVQAMITLLALFSAMLIYRKSLFQDQLYKLQRDKTSPIDFIKFMREKYPDLFIWYSKQNYNNFNPQKELKWMQILKEINYYNKNTLIDLDTRRKYFYGWQLLESVPLIYGVLPVCTIIFILISMLSSIVFLFYPLSDILIILNRYIYILSYISFISLVISVILVIIYVIILLRKS